VLGAARRPYDAKAFYLVVTTLHVHVKLGRMPAAAWATFPALFLSRAGGAEGAMQRQSYMQQGYHQQAKGVLHTAGMCWVQHISLMMQRHSIW
jgi:hypothetical protein